MEVQRLEKAQRLKRRRIWPTLGRTVRPWALHGCLGSFGSRVLS